MVFRRKLSYMMLPLFACLLVFAAPASASSLASLALSSELIVSNQTGMDAGPVDEPAAPPAVPIMGTGNLAGSLHQIIPPGFANAANLMNFPEASSAGQNAGASGSTVAGQDAGAAAISFSASGGSPQGQDLGAPAAGIPLHVEMTTTITTTYDQPRFPAGVTGWADITETRAATRLTSSGSGYGHIGPFPLSARAIIVTVMGLVMSTTLMAYLKSARHFRQERA